VAQGTLGFSLEDNLLVSGLSYRKPDRSQTHARFEIGATILELTTLWLIFSPTTLGHWIHDNAVAIQTTAFFISPTSTYETTDFEYARSSSRGCPT
jgi:hypothetical protein